VGRANVNRECLELTGERYWKGRYQRMTSTQVKTDRPDVSVVLPVSNEEEGLPGVFGELRDQLRALGKSYEIILVADASRDRSFRIIRDLHAQFPDEVVGLRFRRNFGQTAAMSAGFDHARGDVVRVVVSRVELGGNTMELAASTLGERVTGLLALPRLASGALLGVSVPGMSTALRWEFAAAGMTVSGVAAGAHGHAKMDPPEQVHLARNRRPRTYGAAVIFTRSVELLKAVLPVPPTLTRTCTVPPEM